MAKEVSDSSDEVRSAKPLKHAQYARFKRPMKLELGDRLDDLTVCYETYGQLSAAKDNVVLICHAMSGDSHVAMHDEGDDPGWWDIAVGPGKAIDTNHYFVVCPNLLGGCRGTTGPSSQNPATGKPYGRDFPTITIGDMVESQRRLLKHLGIEQLLAVVGGSMGGQAVLQWAAKHPKMIRGAVALATAGRLSAQALAFDVVARNAILTDPEFHGGNYYRVGGGPDRGLAIARMIGHITYLSPEAMKAKFEADRLRPRDVATEFEKTFSVGSYLGYQGDKFVERFDANSYVSLSMAMDLFDMGSTPDALAANLATSSCRWLVVSYTSDWLFPPRQSRDIVAALLAGGKGVSYCNIQSDCGHDAFLLPNELAEYGELMRSFLANVSGRVEGESDADIGGGHPWPPPPDATAVELSAGAGDPLVCPACKRKSTGIFQEGRLDYQRIVELIPPKSSVLDLGCGTGALLSILAGRNHRVLGVELGETSVLECVRRGLDVIHADLEQGLGQFNTRQFDVVVLSQTLQAVRDVSGLVNDMLRVGKQCIVTFPNFGYHKLRNMLSDQGRAPEGSVLSHPWYETPNIRFFTIADFEDFCAQKGIRVDRRITLDTESDREVSENPNLNADLAIFVISR